MSSNGNGTENDVVRGFIRDDRDPRFPRKGIGIPRRYIDITPDEILYDPVRIMGTQIGARMYPTGETILRQPRLETNASTEVEKQCPPMEVPFPCAAPPSQVPYVKRLIHMDQSRDSETIFVHGDIDVPAAVGVVPGVATVLSFQTFNNLRTFIRWIDFTVFDALDPELIGIEIRVEGQPRKFVASPMSSTNSDMMYGAFGTVSSASSLNLQCLPPYFHNVLMEITDQRTVEVVATNGAPAVRKVGVCMWGWIESITVWDESVKR
jgi:hypothetical protein